MIPVDGMAALLEPLCEAGEFRTGYRFSGGSAVVLWSVRLGKPVSTVLSEPVYWRRRYCSKQTVGRRVSVPTRSKLEVERLAPVGSTVGRKADTVD